MNISHKLSVPALQQRCMTFLLTHAAGKPIKAMRIAELFEEEELYREASRFVLENLNGWTEQEMSSLSQETLLKLEKRFVIIHCLLRTKIYSCVRRNWFLERVLKLGLTQIAKEYQCVCHSWILFVLGSEMCSVRLVPTLPPAPVSSKRNGGKPITQFSVSVGFVPSFPPFTCPYLYIGPCQPSMVYRYLRTLEGVTPPLSLTHLSCQITAKAFAATRMHPFRVLLLHTCLKSL